MEDKILFIIPSINRTTITRAVESVLKQTDDRWHLCIVYDKVDEPVFKDSEKITCINLDKKLGKGHNSAGCVRNVAIDKFMLDYKWIGFIDDDDELNENYVSLLFNKYSEYDLVIFRMICTHKHDKTKKQLIPPRSWLGFPAKSNTFKPNLVGISFCFKTPVNTRFIPSRREDYYFVNSLYKEKEISHVITDEIGYYVRGAR